MSRILAVGLATLDIIHTTEAYPAEDAEVRALSQRVARGGNAANTLDVLAQLGHGGQWLGVLADDPEAERIASDLRERGIDCGRAAVARGRCSPVSHVICSRRTGTRTIIHHRDLPELTPTRFAAVPLSDLDWLHFEGRNPPATLEMIRDARARAPDLPISVEVEKPREGVEALAESADLVLFSRVYAEAAGYNDGESFLAAAPARNLAYCAWGSEGAWLRQPDGRAVHRAAESPRRVVDTLGAGDCFNAGVLHAHLSGESAVTALEWGNRIAGAKCGQEGLEGLGTVLPPA